MNTLWLSVALSGGRACPHIGILLSCSIGVPNHFLSTSGKVTSTDSLNRKNKHHVKSTTDYFCTRKYFFHVYVFVRVCVRVYLGREWLRLESSFAVSEFPAEMGIMELSVSMAATSESLTVPGPALGSMMPVDSTGDED